MSERTELKQAALFTAALLLLLVAACSFARAGDALAALNYRRQAVGLRPYLPAPELQAETERSARNQANRGRMYHNSHRGTKHAGVGMASRQDHHAQHFRTCYAFARIQPGTRAAAAFAVGRRGTYYALNVSPRRGQAAQTNQGRWCPKCQRYH